MSFTKSRSQPISLDLGWMRWIILFSGSGAWTTGVAQFEIGASLGGFAYELYHKDEPSNKSWQTITYGSGQSFPVTAGIFYRERRPSRASFATELQLKRLVYVQRSESGSYFSAGSSTEHVKASMLLWGILPEIRLGETHRTVFRFGPQLGIAVYGNMWGEYQGQLMGQPVQGSTGPERPTSSDVAGTMQFMLGFGHRLPIDKAWQLTLDAFASVGMASEVRSDEIGLSLGISRVFHGRSLWALLRSRSPGQGANTTE